MKVDVRGEICPYPQIKAVEAMRKATGGETVELITDHPPSLETVPTQAARLGWTATIQETRPGEWCIHLARQASQTTAR